MKKYFTVLFLVSIFSLNTASGYNLLTPPFIPVMTTGANMPAGLRYPGAAGYSANDSAWIFISGGLMDGNSITGAIYRYNVLGDSWQLITNFPDGSYWISASTVAGNKLYSLGGTYTLALNECTPRVKIYNITTGTWSNGANMPFGRVFHSVTTYQDSLIYCAGGWGFPSGTVYNDVYLYNTITDTWRSAANMPAPRCGGVLAVSGDTLVYVCGGPNWTNPTATNTVFRGRINQSDRSVITWDSAGAVYPGGVRNSIYGASWGNKGIIVSGGYQVTTVTNQVYVYSPGANIWTPQPNMPAPKTDHGAASVYIGSVWKFISAAGTSNRTGSNANTVYILTDTMTGITGNINTGNTLPLSFEVKQNYPNPFNPVTNIEFSLPEGGLVRIAVFDILGRQADVLLNEELRYGIYNIQWDASDFAGGTYFLKIVSGSRTKTIKMLLIK